MNLDNSTKFHVVTMPTEWSTIDDILFETDLIGLQKQFLGGLDAKDIIGLYSSFADAERIAWTALEDTLEES